MRNQSLLTKIALLGSAAAILPMPVLAQDTMQDESGSSQQAADRSTGIQEIIVTARRSAENLQRTPVAVTAVTPAELEERQIDRLADLTRATPSFVALGAGVAGPLVANFAIRGQSQTNPGSGNDGPIGLYVDGVYQARQVLGNAGLIDIASAEVLRGPQGTLFGRNTTGGAFNITTQAPTDIFEGYVKAGYGNYDYYELEGVLNVPLTETIATRFAGRYETRDGYIDNLTTGREEDDIEHNVFGRGSIIWRPTELPITLRITADHANFENNGQPTIMTADDANIFGGALVSDPDDFWTVYGRTVAAGTFSNTVLGLPVGTGATGNSLIDTPRAKVSGTGITANLEVEVGDILVKSITGWKETRNQVAIDLDATPISIGQFYSNYEQEQYSQEIQVSGTAGNLDWIVGAIYFREKGEEQSYSNFFADFGNPRPFNLDDTDYESISKGLFAQLNYQATDRLRVTGGFRYTWDTRNAVGHGLEGATTPDYADVVCRLTGAPVNNAPVQSSGQCDDPRGDTYNYPAWLLSVDYELGDDTFVYLKTSGASLAGGINFRATFAGQETFDPEDVRDVEFGLKTDLFDRRLRLNTAAFYIWRNGLQSNVNPTLPGGRITQFQINSGDARYYGLEFEGTVIPWEGMEIGGSVAYLHSDFVDGSFLAPTSGGSLTADPSDDFYDRSGELVPQAPEWTWSIAATQTVPFSFGELALHADYSYHSTYAFYQNTLDPTVNPAGTPFIATQAGIDRINELGLIQKEGILNGRISMRFADPDVEIAVWGRNLTNEKYFDSPFTGIYGAAGLATATVGPPRTYGVTAQFNF